MEKIITKPYKSKFNSLNLHIKKIIFLYLEIIDLRKIYWFNKKLRNLFPYSAFEINTNTLRKLDYHEIKEKVQYFLELNNDIIACWTKSNIYLIKEHSCHHNIKFNKLEVIKIIPFKTNCFYSSLNPIEISKNSIILSTDGNKELILWDENFNMFQKIKQDEIIYSLSEIFNPITNLSQSFAIGIDGGTIKIYSDKNDSLFNLDLEYKPHSEAITSLLNIPKYNLLLSGSHDNSINVYDLILGKSIIKLTEHIHYICSLIYNNDNLVSSSEDGNIKLWSIVEKFETNILSPNKIILEFICIKNIQAYNNEEQWIYLNFLSNKLIISWMDYSKQFKIWDLKNLEYLETHEEDSEISKLIVNRNKSLIISTWKNEVNLWKIIE